MSFDINKFLEENTFDFDETKYSDYLPMKLEAGWGVFPASKGKFFPVPTNALSDQAKAKAKEYQKEIGTGFVAPAVRQTWYAEFLNRESPKWHDGVWEEMHIPRTEKVNGETLDEPFWAMFKGQWSGDNPPLSPDDFSKKIWVRSVSKPHPSFDPDVPDYMTTKMKDGYPEKDDNGVNKRKYYRLVAEVIGHSLEEAEAWYEKNVGETEANQETQQDDNFTGELMALRDKLPAKDQESFDDATWMDCVKTMFNSVHESGNSEPDWSGWIDVGMNEAVINGVKELAAKYPPF